MSKLKQLLFIDKAELLWDIIKFNGGIKNAMWTLFRLVISVCLFLKVELELKMNNFLNLFLFKNG